MSKYNIDEKTAKLIDESKFKGDRFNPVESIDDSKNNEPQKPQMVEEYKKEIDKVRTNLNNDMTFLINLFLYARDLG